MWNISRQKAVSSRQTGEGGMQPNGRRLVVYGLLPTAFCLLLSGCRMDMQDQPRYEVYEASDKRRQFFADGLSSRPLVEGTIPRGYLRTDKLYYTGKGGAAQAGASGGTTQSVLQTSAPNIQGGTGGQVAGGGDTNVRGNAGGNVGQQQGERSSSSSGGGAGAESDAVEFPFPVTADVLKRGQERYQIYCTLCHGASGDGDGMIVRRGFRRPPTYHSDQLWQAPVGHFFDVITNGWGAMPDYAAQIPVQDRWAIIAYVRALQLSRRVPANQVPPEKLRQAAPANGHKEGGGEQH